MRQPEVGDIVLTYCRVLATTQFVPKITRRPARVLRVFVDEWGIPTVDTELLPATDGEEISSTLGTRHAVDTISWPDIVDLVGDHA